MFRKARWRGELFPKKVLAQLFIIIVMMYNDINNRAEEKKMNARKEMILNVTDMVDDMEADGATDEQARATVLQQVVGVLYGEDDMINEQIAKLLGERLKVHGER